MRYVLWLELGCFYANEAVSEPEVVIRDKRILDANPAAMAAGLEVGMDTRQVRNLVPSCRQVVWSAESYTSRQNAWLDLCVPFTGVIEPLDGHIAVLDLSGHPHPVDIAEKVISKITRETGLPLKYGAGPSVWIAKLASRKHEIREGAFNPARFISSFEVSDLVPIEFEHRERLSFLGYRKIGDVAALPASVLRVQFGDLALRIQQAVRGGVHTPVNPAYPSNVIRECWLFSSSVEDEEVIDQTLTQVAIRLAKRLSGLQATEVELTTQWEDEETQSLSRRFTRPIYHAASILGCLRALNATRRKLEMGIIGLSVNLGQIKPIAFRQRQFFEGLERLPIESTLRSLKQVFGEKAVILGPQIELSRRERVLKEWRHGTGWH